VNETAIADGSPPRDRVAGELDVHAEQQHEGGNQELATGEAEECCDDANEETRPDACNRLDRAGQERLS
jgi:hypothetical protein